jgi:hypothetical protein
MENLERKLEDRNQELGSCQENDTEFENQLEMFRELREIKVFCEFTG